MRRVTTTLAILVSVSAARTTPGQTVIVDNAEPGFTVVSGTWGSGAYGSPYGEDYNWALTVSAGGSPAEVEWRPDLPQADDYEVAVHYVSGANRADNAPFTIHHAGGTMMVEVNQQINDSTWHVLGILPFDAGTGGFVTLGNEAGPSVVIADAVRFRSMSQVVTGDDPRIAIGGALFPAAEDYAMRLDRIDPLILADPGGLFSPAVGVLTTGVTIRFRTDSASIRANFNHISHVVTEGTGYVVFQDGELDQLVPDLEVVDIVSQQPGQPVTWEIVCPSYDEVTFADLEMEPGASVFPLPADRRPRYFALGDSITHGSELDADTKADSTTSYPWVLAASKGWHLYNLAVGGSKVAPAFGSMLAGERSDIITILWGLNDRAHDDDLPLFTSKYDALLDNLRAAQPHTPIYCMTMTTTGSGASRRARYTLDEYRDAIADIVGARQSMGDCHLHLIRAEELTTPADLSDGAHLSVPGAARFAAELANIIGPAWGDFDQDGNWGAGDWAPLADCLTGPDTVPPAGPCDGYDYDCDADVDLREIAAFQAKFGP